MDLSLLPLIYKLSRKIFYRKRIFQSQITYTTSLRDQILNCMRSLMTEKEEAQCPLSKAALLLSSKWDLIVIHNIESVPIRFSELKDKISAGIDKPVTASSLSRILKRLELNKIIRRIVKSQIGESVEISYELTNKGIDLKPVILNLQQWSEKHLLD